MANGIRDLLPRSVKNRKMKEAIEFGMKCYREYKVEQEAAKARKIVHIETPVAVAQAA